MTERTHTMERSIYLYTRAPIRIYAYSRHHYQLTYRYSRKFRWALYSRLARISNFIPSFVLVDDLYSIGITILYSWKNGR